MVSPGKITRENIAQLKASVSLLLQITMVQLTKEHDKMTYLLDSSWLENIANSISLLHWNV